MTTVVEHDWQETGYVCQYRFTIPHCNYRKVRHFLGGDALQLQLAGVKMKPADEADNGGLCWFVWTCPKQHRSDHFPRVRSGK